MRRPHLPLAWFVAAGALALVLVASPIGIDPVSLDLDDNAGTLAANDVEAAALAAAANESIDQSVVGAVNGLLGAEVDSETEAAIAAAKQAE